MTDLDNFRAEKDQFFSTDRQSPLTVEQKLHFNGISYFPEDLALVFEVTVEEFDPRLSVKMQTSTGKIQVYERYGKISFIVDGQDVELTVMPTWKAVISCLLSTLWRGMRRTAPVATWNLNRWREVVSWLILTWPITHTAPSMMAGPAR